MNREKRASAGGRISRGGIWIEKRGGIWIEKRGWTRIEKRGEKRIKKRGGIRIQGQGRLALLQVEPQGVDGSGIQAA